VTTDLSLVVASILLVLLNGFFVAAEFSIVKLRHTRVEAIEDTAGWRGRILAIVHRNLDAYLSACQLGITLASLGLGWIGEPAFADLLEPLFTNLGITDPRVVHGMAFFFAFLTISYLHIVIGELAPKSMAIRMSERVGLWTAAPLYLFYWVMYPMIWVLNHSAAWILRSLGLDLTKDHDSGYSADELKLILRSPHVDSSYTSVQRRVMTAALDFGEIDVTDLMRPFDEAVVLSRGDTVEASLEVIATHRFSRYPYLDEQQQVIGIVHLKDLFLALLHGPVPRSLDEIARPSLVVSPRLSAAELFRRFRQEGLHLAVVAHAGSRPLGFVTFDDLLSALVGEIRDEFRESRADWVRLEDGSLRGKGSLPIFTLEQRLGIDIDAPDARTVGGLILHQLEDLPHEGQRIDFETFEVEVERMEGARISLVRVHPKAESDDMRD